MKHLAMIFLLIFVFLISTFSTSFAQLPWTKDASNPIMSGGAAGAWNRHVFYPIVLYNPDSLRYEMWFSASVGSPWEPYRTGFATSIDGITWTKLDTAVLKPSPGTWDESAVAAIAVIRENGTYKMWYVGWSSSDNRTKIGYATSPDGITWTKYPSNPVMTPGTAAWEAGGPDYATVMPVSGGGYKMWYTGFNAGFNRSKIGYATSGDGITWARADSVNPVLTTGLPNRWDDANVSGARVVIINNIYHMWYSGNRLLDNPRQTGWATSIDGIHWRKYNDPNTTSTLYLDSDPVLEPSSGQWDGNFTQAVTVMLEGDSLRMWYQGNRSSTGTYLWRIGHATAPLTMPVTILVPEDLPSIQAAIDSASDGNIVLVADGTYQENINFKGKAITVASHYYFDGDTSHISNTIIDGSNPSHPDSGSVVYLISGEDTTSVLNGFTLTNGSGTNSHYTWGGVQYPCRSGGGIFCWNSGGRFVSNKIINNTITGTEPFGGGLSTGDYGSNAWIILEKNTIINNTLNGGTQGAFGGGVGLSYNGKITDNVISYNSCISTGYLSGGGGLYLDTESIYPRTVYVEGNQITHNFVQGRGTPPNDNWAAQGGGILNRYSKVLILDNEISYNQLTNVVSGNGCGGGIYMSQAANGSMINRNTISYDTSECTGTNYGGGIGLGTGNGLSITNNIISGNSATHGGGIRVRENNAAIINNTIVNNTASTIGGGLHSYNSNPILVNNILWDNQAPNNAGIDPSSLTRVRYSDIQGTNVYPGQGNINADPFFADTLSYNLSDSSKCVGWGTDSIQISSTWYNSPKFDFDGDPRPNPIDEYVDIGAQESPYSNPWGIEKEESDYLPTVFSLKQNYPNPFNPSTTIEFSIPRTETVKLKIYNLLGQEVTTLVSDKLTPGEYKYTWDASKLASGVYFYKLEAGSFSSTRKLILLK